MDVLRKRVFEDLEKMNIVPEDTLLIHASYKALEEPSLTAIAFLKLLVNYLHTGTLLFPALSYKFVTPQNPCFDNRKTASCVGYLSEVFRTQLNAVRSNHPTHSVCALGKEAVSLTHLHHKDETPCGKNSPFTLLPQYNGKILMLGCNLKPNTFMHSVEEVIQPNYLFGKKINYTLIDDKGTYSEKEYLTHGFESYVQRYDRVIDLNDPKAFIKEGSLLNAKCYVLNARELRDHAVEKMNRDATFFVDKIENSASNDI